MIEARGYVVLNWGDVGWVHFFTNDAGDAAGRHAQDEAVHLGRGRQRDAGTLEGERLSRRAAGGDRHPDRAANRTDRSGARPRRCMPC